LASAGQAVSHASDAQASASSARAAAVAAGRDAAAAADAASDARRYAYSAAMREAIMRARTTAGKAQEHKANGVVPADDTGNTRFFGLWPEDWNNPLDAWAAAKSHADLLSKISGFWGGVSILTSIAAPFHPVARMIDVGVNLNTLQYSVMSTWMTYQLYGSDSVGFRRSLGSTAIGAVFFGSGHLIDHLGNKLPVPTARVDILTEQVGGAIIGGTQSATGWLIDVLGA
jgi:hypothetical protein